MAFMQQYEYRCIDCGANVCEIRAVDDRNNPAPCNYCGGALARKFSRLLFTVHRAADNPENRVYHGTKEEIRAMQKADDARYEKLCEGWSDEKPKHTTVDDLMRTGILEAARTPEGLARWREDYVTAPEPVNDFSVE